MTGGSHSKCKNASACATSSRIEKRLDQSRTNEGSEEEVLKRRDWRDPLGMYSKAKRRGREGEVGREYPSRGTMNWEEGREERRWNSWREGGIGGKSLTANGGEEGDVKSAR